MLAFGWQSANAQCGVSYNVTPNEALGVNSVVLELTGVGGFVGFSVGIDWGDGTPWSIGFESSWVHTYPGPGTYNICVNFVAPDCIQEDICNNYTLTTTPEHADLCPITASYSVSGNTITCTISGSGAVEPSVSFHHDILGYLDNPFDLSGFQFIDAHSGTFTYTYSPPSEDATYIFCAGYTDLNVPEACETNDYCSAVTFGNPVASVAEDQLVSVLEVYPCPASEFINIYLGEAGGFENVNWQMINLPGEVVLQGQLEAQTTTVLLPAEMPVGNYQLVLTSEKGQRSINFVKY